MFQKTLVVSAVIAVILLSFLFAILILSTGWNIQNEQHRIERYLEYSAANAIHIIRNEILYLFENMSDEIRTLNGEGWDGDLDSLPLNESYQLEGFPSLVKGIEYIKPGQPSEQVLLQGVPDSSGQYGEILAMLTRKTLEARVSVIKIHDFKGYMIFPVKTKETGEAQGVIAVFLDITEAVDTYMPERLASQLMTTSKGLWEVDRRNYSVVVKEGRELAGSPLPPVNIDLNVNFNLFDVSDYYYTRPDSFQPFPLRETVTENHNYLIISHEDIEKEGLIRKKIRAYGALILLYIVLVAAILLFLYSVYRIRRQYQREQQFTSLISHELKTPLSVIQLASESLSGGFVTDGGDVKEYGLMIKDETGRLGRMIENILMISTLSWTGREEVPVYPENLMEELRTKNGSLIKREEIAWESDNRWGDSAFYSRPSLLMAALQNLIHNAIVYGASRGEDRRLILRAEKVFRRKREGILFSVIDHGPGVDKHEAAKIFSHFYRGREVRENQMPGSGMGLALTKRIAEGLGGTLILNRSLKESTVFQMWIPVRMENEKNFAD